MRQERTLLKIAQHLAKCVLLGALLLRTALPACLAVSARLESIDSLAFQVKIKISQTARINSKCCNVEAPNPLSLSASALGAFKTTVCVDVLTITTNQAEHADSVPLPFVPLGCIEVCVPLILMGFVSHAQTAQTMLLTPRLESLTTTTIAIGRATNIFMSTQMETKLCVHPARAQPRVMWANISVNVKRRKILPVNLVLFQREQFLLVKVIV